MLSQMFVRTGKHYDLLTLYYLLMQMACVLVMNLNLFYTKKCDEHDSATSRVENSISVAAENGFCVRYGGGTYACAVLLSQGLLMGWYWLHAVHPKPILSSELKLDASHEELEKSASAVRDLFKRHFLMLALCRLPLFFAGLVHICFLSRHHTSGKDARGAPNSP